MGSRFLTWLFYRTSVGPILGVVVLLILAGGVVLRLVEWLLD
jgi:hypothetical protein